MTSMEMKEIFPEYNYLSLLIAGQVLLIEN